jgi:tetratricopeptide (TPR) repeat protein
MSDASEPESDAAWANAARRAADLDARGETERADEAFTALIDRLVAASRLPESQPGYTEPAHPLDSGSFGRSARSRSVGAIRQLAYEIPNRRPDLEARLWQALHDRGADGEQHVGPLVPANNAGALWERAGQLDRAEHVLSEGITRARLDPERHAGTLERLLIHHGSVLIRLGRLGEARTALDEAGALNANSGDERNRVDLAERRERLNRAEESAAGSP